MEKNDTPSPEPGKNQVLLNLFKLIFLAVVLAGAWYLLDRLISGK